MNETSDVMFVLYARIDDLQARNEVQSDEMWDQEQIIKALRQENKNLASELEKADHKLSTLEFWHD